MTAVEVQHRPDRDVAALIAGLEVPPDELPIDVLRENLAAWVGEVTGRTPRIEIGSVRDDVVSGASGSQVPVRVYEPAEGALRLRQTVAFFHGGGWVAGSVETADAFCRAVVDGLGARVVSVEYRLAPESPFPAPLDDCLTVVEALSRQGREIVVAGESAGGNLAAATALACRDSGITLGGQVLINPVLGRDTNTDSYLRYGTGYGLTTSDLKRYLRLYAGESETTTPLFAPLDADSLHAVAPAVVTTAGFDPLLDDGVRYSARLVEAGVPLIYLPMPTMLHGWVSLIAVADGARREFRRLLTAVGAMADGGAGPVR